MGAKSALKIICSFKMKFFKQNLPDANFPHYYYSELDYVTIDQ
jgi:hypothetical protein